MRTEIRPADLYTALTSGLGGGADPEGAELSAFLARVCGPSTLAILHYGSRAQGRRTTPDSAYDFFVIVESDRDVYRALAATISMPCAPAVATALARAWPPNVIALTQPATPEPRRAKCCVLSLGNFERACSGRARDHFVQGRLLQVVLLTWSRDAAAAAVVTAAVARVRARSFIWGRPSLPPRFTVDDYVEAIIARSLAGEIRPEEADHVHTLVAAQHGALRGIYGPLLEHHRKVGNLTAAGVGAYRLAPTAMPGRFGRMRVRLYFHRSKLRATIRLLKHVVLYEGWLDYIVRKVERSGGAPVKLTDRERRWPLVFLWPKVIHFVRHRPQRRP